MTYQCFSVDIKNKIAHLQLKRGDELNSMTLDFWRELPEIIKDIDDGAKARVIVISSSGKHFSSGMDLSVFSSGALTAPSKEIGRSRAFVREKVLSMQQTFNVLDNIRMPVLVAIQGGCIGGGLDMISACDCRYATEDAFFVIQQISLAVTADTGTFPRLCNLIPQGMLREMSYSGRKLSAQRALEIGLINAILPTHEELIVYVMNVAKDIAEKSPLAVYGSKVMINYARDHSIADSLDYIATWQSGMFHLESDVAECFRARNEKRTPQFEDLLPKE